MSMSETAIPSGLRIFLKEGRIQQDVAHMLKEIKSYLVRLGSL